MKKRFFGKKRIALSIMSTVLALLMLTGCAGTSVKETGNGETEGSEGETKKTDPVKETEKETKEPDPPVDPSLSKMKQFDISFFWGPQGKLMQSDRVVREIAECGFTSIPIENQSSPEDIKKILTTMKKYGLTCSALMDSRITSLFRLSLKTEEAEKAAAEVVEDYKDFDNIRGWWITDEPSKNDFMPLGKIVEALRKYDPERSAAINLFPNGVNAGVTGGGGYQGYLNNFISTVKPSYLSYDQYGFINGGLKEGMFTNLEIIRKTALDNGLQAMQVVLLTQHESYDNLTRAQIKWEVAMDLLYGMKRISYFTYGQPNANFKNACIDQAGKKTDHYYDVQAVNAWAKPIGDELFSKTSTAVFHTGRGMESGCTRYNGYGDLGKISSNDHVIGFFDDGSFMVANKQYKGDEANVLTTKELKDGLEFFDPADSTWKSADNCPEIAKNADGFYEISLLPGDALLLRVSK